MCVLFVYDVSVCLISFLCISNNCYCYVLVVMFVCCVRDVECVCCCRVCLCAVVHMCICQQKFIFCVSGVVR